MLSDAMGAATKRRGFALPLIYADEQLTGVAPAALERAAKTCVAGDATHRGLVFLSATLAHHALRRCTPPGAHAVLLAPLATAVDWARGTTDAVAVKRARSDAFTASLEVEQRTLDAVATAVLRTPRTKKTGLDDHADRVVRRYTGLAASYAAGAVVRTLDAIDSPPEHALVPSHVAGAVAYQAAGLGPARSQELRAKAWQQAEAEAERPGAPSGHPIGALAVQLLHEYLGSYWKDVSDGQRLYLGDFIEWALQEH